MNIKRVLIFIFLIFILFIKCIFYPKRAESFNSINPIKIYIDEKPMMDFIDSIPKIFESNICNLELISKYE